MVTGMATSTSSARSGAYRTIWRWHFYAGLFVIPFVVILSLTGAAYLFKPQVERWEERDFHYLSTSDAVTPQAQVDAALAGFPGARFNSYRLPESEGDAVMIHLAMPDGRSMRDVFISPQGKVLGSIAPDARLMEWTKRIHGQLLLGSRGSWLVELAASWAIVLVLSGLYLWWPRGHGLAGVAWPRIRGGRRIFWRDLHAVTGFWISGLVLVLLVTGLPWTGLWGSAFNMARTEMGWVKSTPDWTLGGRAPPPVAGIHAVHDHAAMMQTRLAQAPDIPTVGIDDMVAKAQEERLAFPAIITPPGAPGRFGASSVDAWTIRSDAEIPSRKIIVTYDRTTGQEISREGFAEGHLIDRVIGYGIAWHQGQLFGWVNQLIGVLTALGLIVMSVSGAILWWRRKPDDTLGAPPLAQMPARMGGAVAILMLLAVLLPLLAASLAALWLLERLALPRLPRFAQWLGAP